MKKKRSLAFLLSVFLIVAAASASLFTAAFAAEPAKGTVTIGFADSDASGPSTEEGGGSTVYTIPDNDVPLSSGLVSIPDGNVPLGPLPGTGGNSLFTMLFILAGMGFLLTAGLIKLRENLAKNKV